MFKEQGKNQILAKESEVKNVLDSIFQLYYIHGQINVLYLSAIQEVTMKYFRKLIGDKCYLSPVSIEDAEKYTEWVNDLEIGQFVLFSAGVYDLDKERDLLKHLMINSTIFAIVEKDTNKVIGNCGLHMVNEIHRRASFGIFIGEKTYWNQGIGREATALALDYGFNILNLNNISLEVVAYNHRAVNCYTKVGFKLVGTLRKYAFNPITTVITTIREITDTWT